MANWIENLKAFSLTLSCLFFASRTRLMFEYVPPRGLCIIQALSRRFLVSCLFAMLYVQQFKIDQVRIWPRLLRRPHVKCQSFLRSWKPLPCHARFLSSRCDKKRKRPICFCEFLCPPARAKINYTNQDVLCRHSPGSRCVLQKAFIGN